MAPAGIQRHSGGRRGLLRCQPGWLVGWVAGWLLAGWLAGAPGEEQHTVNLQLQYAPTAYMTVGTISTAVGTSRHMYLVLLCRRRPACCRVAARCSCETTFMVRGSSRSLGVPRRRPPPMFPRGYFPSHGPARPSPLQRRCHSMALCTSRSDCAAFTWRRIQLAQTVRSTCAGCLST